MSAGIASIGTEHAAESGVVEHAVEPAPAVERQVDGRLNLLLGPDLATREDGLRSEFACQRLPALVLHVGDDHPGAFGDEQPGRLCPDAAPPLR